jgi:deazaflavin-dependent oxidoreductase (nitroreductase family)
MLRVHGRRTGKLQTTPVMVLHLGGFRYLVAPRGETDWARNLRRAGWGELIRGRRVERVTATEVEGEERVTALTAYVRRYGWLTGRFFEARARDGRDGIRRIAGRHPTFRIGAMVAVLTLAVAGPALGARAGHRVPESALPPDADRARVMLQRAWDAAPPGSQARKDIKWVLKLDRLHLLRRGGPLGRRSTVARTMRLNAWWYSRNTAPNSRIIVRDHDGILSTYWEGRGLAVNPVATTGRWQDLNAGLTPEQLADSLLPFAVRRHAAGRSFTVWEYYDVPDRPKLVLPGASGMAQGRIAQLMARAYHRTGEPKYAKAAAGALAAFTVPVSKGGVVSRVGPSSAWYVERAFPGAGPWKGAALNGFMVTLLNLEAAAPYLSSRPKPRTRGPVEKRIRPRARGAERAGEAARDIVARGEQTLARYLPLHDTGSWSLYGLSTPGWAWRTHLADAGYHCYHVELLRQLDGQAPGYGFGGWAARWNGYARRAGLDCSLKNPRYLEPRPDRPPESILNPPKPEPEPGAETPEDSPTTTTPSS